MNQKNEQKSYILRLWRSHPDQTWRILLKPITTNDTPHHFTNFKQLVSFLQTNKPINPLITE